MFKLQYVKVTGMNYCNGSDNVYLLISISHMESGLHAVKVGGGSGTLVGGTAGVGQSGW